MRTGGGKGDALSVDTRSLQPHPVEGERPALWDPVNALPSARKWIWALLAVHVLIAQGPTFLRNIPGRWDGGNDFFQDWTSARNVLEGRPAYLPLSVAAALHGPKMGGRPAVIPRLPWNAHPPTSVLATLPLALLDYLDAVTLWNVLGLIAITASLALIFRELRFPVAAWSILPIVTLGLLCGPVRGQISQGQWNAPLLLLLTLAWVAGRRGRDSWAGIWVGSALTLKLFPVFFFLYFVIQRRWRALIAACLWSVALSLVTIAALGLDAYRDYYNLVLPTLREFRSGWNNASLQAFWLKNFAVGANHYGLYAEPMVRGPLLAQTGIVLSYAAVLVTTFFFVKWSKPICSSNSKYEDLRYSLTMVTMLLLAPVCWDHYLLLLALPLALVWSGLGRSNFQRLAFLLLVAAVWVGPNELWRVGGVDLVGSWPDFQDVPPRTYLIHRPLFVLAFLSVHFYALLALYLWLVFLLRREIGGAKSKA